MTTVLEGCTTEEQRSVERFSVENGLNVKATHTEIFPVYGGNCLLCNEIHSWVANVSLMT
jgi:hypothetical protein